MKTQNRWTANEISELAGKVAIITGANSGIGFESSRFLAKKNAQVVIACRDMAKGDHSARKIIAEHPSSYLVVMQLDLANLASVRIFSREFHSNFTKLDILINNAGVMAKPFQKTGDGFELQFATNHLGHFALTGLLLNLLIHTPQSRIVTVSSVVHWIGSIRFYDLNSEQFHNRWLAYGKSKLANLLFAYELQRRLHASGSSTISLAAHPGYAATNLQHNTVFNFLNPLFAQSAEMGAYPLLFAATSTDAQGGDFIGPDQFFGQRGYPYKAKSSGASHDKKMAARLWEDSERLTGVRFHFT
jgi:NAD(P)-dependent dehydrogenase (short-subunit alcohol dehydrogenase family)